RPAQLEEFATSCGPSGPSSSDCSARRVQKGPGGYAGPAKIDGKLSRAVQSDELLDEAVLEGYCREGTQAVPRGKQTERLGKMTRVQPDVPVCVLQFVFP